MQDKSSLDNFYQNEDPWGYKTNSEDAKRKQIIIDTLKKYGTFSKAIDVGAGEGWITADLPASEFFGFEISDVAASRFPANVNRVTEYGQYDLITACGV